MPAPLVITTSINVSITLFIINLKLNVLNPVMRKNEQPEAVRIAVLG